MTRQFHDRAALTSRKEPLVPIWQELSGYQSRSARYGKMKILHPAGVRLGHAVVKAVGYKPEGRRFETRWGEISSLHNPSGLTRPWGLLSL
jgi:hypothetical protein